MKRFTDVARRRTWLWIGAGVVLFLGAAWAAAHSPRWSGLMGLAAPVEPPAADLSQANASLVKAIERERRAVQQAPGSAEAWGRLGMRYMAHHHVEPAIACFQQAAEAAPDDFRWSYYQAVLLEETDLNAALEQHRLANAKNPKYAAGRLRWAGALSRANHWDQASREYTVARELASKDDPLVGVAAAIGLARAMQARGDLNKAQSTLASAVAEAPWSQTAQRELARVSARLGDWDSARRAQQQAERLPPGPSEPPDEALAAVEELELVSRRLGMEADQRAQQQDLEGAAKALEKMIAERPDLARPRLNLGQIRFVQGRLREAIQIYGDVVRAFPQDAMARYQLGMALDAIHDSAGALSRYEQCIAIKPDYAEAHFSMGLVLEKLNRREDAIAAYRRAVEASPGFAPAHLALGAAIHAQGDAAGAVDHVRRATQLAPGDPAPKEYLDRLTKELAP